MVAKILLAREAVPARIVGVAEPRHADAVAGSKSFDTPTERLDAPDDLVPEHERQLRLRKLAVEDM
jgi:hypothetical protein